MDDITFTTEALEEFMYWVTQDKKTVKRINKLIKDIQRSGAMQGIGKPEPLKHNLQGAYSRRIDDFNRLVYFLDESNNIKIISCKGHYEE